jgi:hypothetical protein
MIVSPRDGLRYNWTAILLFGAINEKYGMSEQLSLRRGMYILHEGFRHHYRCHRCQQLLSSSKKF